MRSGLRGKMRGNIPLQSPHDALRSEKNMSKKSKLYSNPNIKNVISELEPLLKWILHEHDNVKRKDNPKLLRHVNQLYINQGCCRPGFRKIGNRNSDP